MDDETQHYPFSLFIVADMLISKENRKLIYEALFKGEDSFFSSVTKRQWGTAIRLYCKWTAQFDLFVRQPWLVWSWSEWEFIESLTRLNNIANMITHWLLLIDGVLVAPKDYNLSKHQEIDVPNLQVVKAMQSLTSRGYVKTQFSWQWYYYSLTNEGIDYLREFLHLPTEIVPATLKRAARPAAAPRRTGGRNIPFNSSKTHICWTWP